MEGYIVAVINPTIMPAKEKGKFSLKVTSAMEIAKLGQFVDFKMYQHIPSLILMLYRHIYGFWVV